MPQQWSNAEATLRHDLNNILDKAIQITNPRDLVSSAVTQAPAPH